MEKLVLVAVVAVLCFFWFTRFRYHFNTSYRVSRLEKLNKGWRGEVVATRRNLDYVSVWVSEGGSEWHNVETFQRISASNWGGGGDALADMLSDAVDHLKAQETVTRITGEVL